MRKLVKFLLSILTKHLFSTKVYNKEVFKTDGPTIIMPNHVSFLDPFFLAPFLPENTYFVIHTYYAKKFRHLLKFVNHIAIDPLNPYSLKTLLPVIKKGYPVVIFPEGRLTETGGVMKIYSGLGLLAARTGATLYPVAMEGLEFSKLSRVNDKYKTRFFPKVKIYFDKPFTIEKCKDKRFRNQKEQIADRISSTLQNAKYKLKQCNEDNSSIFNSFLTAGKLHGLKKVIVSDAENSLTYRKAIMSSYVLGRKLSALLKDEDTVGVLLPNSTGHFVTLFSLFYEGKTPAILNFSAGSANNIDCCQTAGVKTILSSKRFMEKANLEEYFEKLSEQFRIVYLEDVKKSISLKDKLYGLVKYHARVKSKSPDKNRIILFTSGSESKPKGVVLNHSNIMANIHQLSSTIAYTPKDNMLNALPMFHSFGLTAGTLLPVLNGLSVYLYPSPLHYKIIPEIAYMNDITMLLGTPTFLMGYAKNAHPYDFYSLRLVLSGGEKLKDEVRAIWLEKFGIKVLEGYGTTEASPVLCVNTPLYNRPGTVGKLIPGIEYKLEKVDGIYMGGNLFVKGANIMEGYLISGKGFVPVSEWYNTGDVVDIDKDGFVVIKSRLKRFAKISGEMVSLDAIENIAQMCFGSAQFAAVIKAHPKKGEVIVLFSTCPNSSRSALREYLLKTGQSMILLPNEIITLEKIPLLGSGKFDYVSLSKAS